MSQEDYGQAKRLEIGQVAQGMLDGSVHYLEGAIALTSLRHEIGAYANDLDFIAFVAVMARINNLPFNPLCHDWSQPSSPEHEREIEKAVTWAKEFSLPQCEALAMRFRR